MKFDDLAKNWETEEVKERAELVSEKIKKLKGNNARKALEFGAGTGLISFKLKDEFDQIDLIDTSANMLKVAQERDKTIKVFNINILEEEIDEKYDVIYTSMALHHVLEVDKAIEKFYSLLNEKGQLYIIDLEPDNGDFHYGVDDFNGYDGFSKDEIEGKLKKANFKIEKFEDIFTGEKNQKGKDITYTLFMVKAIK
ncbi:class I SAM-dependent methyltransferase [uncultured Clostridium sp.]|uniref:class I SAM-dependent DNA methyltransferase n=1 Tax=uncultured Clostridium sp. TaxID=59620 RepID=UPI002610356C|nr:class I SAM-dependent methyltransferase [uncultured Clostridium sp.]